MGILAAILAGIGSALLGIGKAIGGFLAAIPAGGWLLIVIAGIAFYFGCQQGGGCGCGCRRQPRPPKPPREWTLTVESVPTGASIVVKTGLRERKTATISLAYVSAPAAGEPFAEESRANLERLAGKRVRIVAVKPVVAAVVEARLPACGIVYGESGALLAVAQLEAGWAKCENGAPQLYCDAQNAARKAKKGQWQ